MQISSDGIALIKIYEECRLTAYPDPKTGGDPWTCGWGTTGHGIGPGTVWTQQQADAAFQADMDEFAEMANNAIHVTVNQDQFSAFVSILENVGPGSSEKDGIIRLKSGQPSTLLRKLNAGDFAGASAEFPKWDSPGTNVTNGLERRRLAEKAMFDRPQAPATWGNEARR